MQQVLKNNQNNKFTAPEPLRPRNINLMHQRALSSINFPNEKRNSTVRYQNAPQYTSILARLCAFDDGGIMQHIFFNKNLQTILLFRLVSTHWYAAATFVQTEHTYTPLSSKVSMSFEYSKLNPQSDFKIQEKFEFAQKHTNVEIKFSVDDLFSEKSDYNEKLSSYLVSKNRLTKFLTVEDMDDLNRLQKLFNESDKALIDSVRELNLKNIEITDNPDSRHLVSISFLMFAENNSEPLKIGLIPLRKSRY